MKKLMIVMAMVVGLLMHGCVSILTQEEAGILKNNLYGLHLGMGRLEVANLVGVPNEIVYMLPECQETWLYKESRFHLLLRLQFTKEGKLAYIKDK